MRNAFVARKKLEGENILLVDDIYTTGSTIEEAAKYFRIGESKLRKLAEENPVPDWVMMNGNRIQIKRKQFEKMIDTVDAI